MEVLECDVLKWRNGLSDLLTDEKGQQAFAKFLKSEYSGENLSFWLHTRRYRRAPSKYSELSGLDRPGLANNNDISVNSHRRIARVIYDKHISEDCGEPVNLPQRESSTILNALESEQALNRFLFDDAAEESDRTHIKIPPIFADRPLSDIRNFSFLRPPIRPYRFGT